MRKKLLALITVLALAISSIGMTAFAAEVGDTISVTSMDELEPGTYELDATLSCYLPNMGGVEFGTPLLTGNVLTVNTDGTAELTLEFTPHDLTIYSISTKAFASEIYFYGGDMTGFFGIKSGDEWIEATHTLSAEDDTVEGNYKAGKAQTQYVTSMTVPVSAVADTYDVAVSINSNTMGMQFGGPNAKYDGTLTVNWANTKVLSLVPVQEDTLEAGSYAVDLTWIAAMDNMFDPVLTINEDGTFEVIDAKSGASKGAGTVAFDKYAGEYTLTYENGSTTTFTFDEDAKEITFTSKLWFGKASFNNVDANGVFVPYVAYIPYEDTLEVGSYAVDLTWIAAMDNMFDPVLTINEDGTFEVIDAKSGASKGAGTVAFDDRTGEYTLTYENGSTTTFTYDEDAKEITFTSKLWFGKASFNNVDANGEFVPYTATLVVVEPEEEEETTTETEEETTTEAEEEDTTSDKDSAPDTSDNAPVVFYAVVAVAALGGAILFTKKRNA